MLTLKRASMLRQRKGALRSEAKLSLGAFRPSDSYFDERTNSAPLPWICEEVGLVWKSYPPLELLLR